MSGAQQGGGTRGVSDGWRETELCNEVGGGLCSCRPPNPPLDPLPPPLRRYSRYRTGWWLPLGTPTRCPQDTPSCFSLPKNTPTPSSPTSQPGQPLAAPAPFLAGCSAVRCCAQGWHRQQAAAPVSPAFLGTHGAPCAPTQGTSAPSCVPRLYGGVGVQPCRAGGRSRTPPPAPCSLLLVKQQDVYTRVSGW